MMACVPNPDENLGPTFDYQPNNMSPVHAGA